MKKKDIVSILDLTKEEILTIFKMTEKLKKNPFEETLKGRTLGMIFNKPSTRTRVSFEVAMTQLGGHAIYMNSADLQLRRGETISDTGKTLSRYLDIIMIRTFDHNDVVELASSTTIPVINGLTDLLHPCQVLSDIFTIIEKKNTCLPDRQEKVDDFNFQDLTIVFVGDGNNVCNSFINAQKILKFNLIVSTPEKYKPELLESNKDVKWVEDPFKAVEDADIIYTDTWTSMGKEEERDERLKVFKKYQVNKKLLENVKKKHFVMHCLPAKRGEEITDDVIDGESSIVFDQAENRLHVQKAIIKFLLGYE
ncbi:MAG: ornithine carbamoyltransferase [Caldiserica bacterium]|nr:MAG: ornithine carbamoyltransferase [Caldisericota bacterium]